MIEKLGQAIFLMFRGLAFDGLNFSTKKFAYTISVVVTSYLVLVNVPSVEIWTIYVINCAGPGAFREFLRWKSGDQSGALEPPKQKAEL